VAIQMSRTKVVSDRLVSSRVLGSLVTLYTIVFFRGPSLSNVIRNETAALPAASFHCQVK
jgi:hypothetical protein